MDIKGFYRDKTILLTGATGFVGKVVLEKFMRSLPDFKRLYVMIRPKKTVTMRQRLDAEILDTEIFNFIYTAKPEIKEAMKKKIVPVPGDLVVDRLGMSDEVRAMLTAECDIIINCIGALNIYTSQRHNDNYYKCVFTTTYTCSHVWRWICVSSKFIIVRTTFTVTSRRCYPYTHFLIE